MYIRKIDDSWSFKNADTKEFTHCYHSYPAMMIPQVGAPAWPMLLIIKLPLI